MLASAKARSKPSSRSSTCARLSKTAARSRARAAARRCRRAPRQHNRLRRGSAATEAALCQAGRLGRGLPQPQRASPRRARRRAWRAASWLTGAVQVVAALLETVWRRRHTTRPGWAARGGQRPLRLVRGVCGRGLRLRLCGGRCGCSCGRRGGLGLAVARRPPRWRAAASARSRCLPRCLWARRARARARPCRREPCGPWLRPRRPPCCPAAAPGPPRSRAARAPPPGLAQQSLAAPQVRLDAQLRRVVACRSSSGTPARAARGAAAEALGRAPPRGCAALPLLLLLLLPTARARARARHPPGRRAPGRAASSAAEQSATTAGQSLRAAVCGGAVGVAPATSGRGARPSAIVYCSTASGKSRRPGAARARCAEGRGRGGRCQ